MSEASRRAAEIVHEISEIDMPISVDKCESYMCEHWAAKAAEFIDTAITRAVEGERAKWQARCDQYRRAITWLMECTHGDEQMCGCRDRAMEILSALRAPGEKAQPLPEGVEFGVTCGCGQTPVHSTIDKDFHPGCPR